MVAFQCCILVIVGRIRIQFEPGHAKGRLSTEIFLFKAGTCRKNELDFKCSRSDGSILVSWLCLTFLHCHSVIFNYFDFKCSRSAHDSILVSWLCLTFLHCVNRSWLYSCFMMLFTFLHCVISNVSSNESDVKCSRFDHDDRILVSWHFFPLCYFKWIGFLSAADLHTMALFSFHDSNDQS